MARKPRRPASPLNETERTVTEALGKLMELWGFRPALGRLWALLYLSPAPLSAPRLCEMLRMSSGAVSMGLTELQRWGVARKVWVQGERRDHYAAEQDVWKMVSRVLREREAREIDLAHQAFARASQALGRGELPDAAARYQRERVAELEELALAGKDLLDLLLANQSLGEVLAHEHAVHDPSPAPARPRLPADMPDFKDG